MRASAASKGLTMVNRRRNRQSWDAEVHRVALANFQRAIAAGAEGDFGRGVGIHRGTELPERPLGIYAAEYSIRTMRVSNHHATVQPPNRTVS